MGLAHQPVISVVIPTRNRADLLMRAVLSAQRQSVPVHDIVIVDDASEDNTSAVVAQIPDRRIAYIQHSTPQGGSAARNSGIKAAQGELVALLDSDDHWLPQKLRTQLGYLAQLPGGSHGRRGLITCAYRRVGLGPSRGVVPGALRRTRFIYRSRQDIGPFTASSFMVPRRLVTEGYWFDSSLPALQDLDFAYRIGREFPIVGPAKVLVRKYHDPGRHHVFTGASEREARAIFFAKHRAEIEGDPEQHARHYQLLALNFARAREYDQAREYFRQAREIWPRGRVYAALSAVSARPPAALWLERALRLVEDLDLRDPRHASMRAGDLVRAAIGLAR